MFFRPEIDKTFNKLGKINLREQFELLQNQFSISIFIIRKNKLTKCKCYNPLHRTGDANCKICGGSGMLNTIEKIEAIQQTMDTEDALQNTELGIVVSDLMCFYINHKDIPFEKDELLIVGYNEKKIPIDIKENYIIQSVQPLKGDNGRIELYKVFAKKSQERIQINQKRFNSIPIQQKIKLMQGKKFTWKM